MATINNNTDAIESGLTVSDSVKVTTTSVKFGPTRVMRGPSVPANTAGRNGDLFILDDTATASETLQSAQVPTDASLYQKRPAQVSSGPASVQATDGGILALNGDSITINGVAVIFSGGDLTTVAADIEAAFAASATPMVVQVIPTSQTGSVGGLPQAGDALGIDLGSGSTTVTFTAPFTLANAIAQINAAGIAGLIVNQVNNALVLTSMGGLPITLTNIGGSVLANLGPFNLFGGTVKITETTGDDGLGFTFPVGASAVTLDSRLTNIPPSPTVLGGRWVEVGSGGSIIIDADEDTSVDVERTPDDDTIRFQAAGFDAGTITSTGTRFTSSMNNSTLEVSDANVGPFAFPGAGAFLTSGTTILGSGVFDAAAGNPVPAAGNFFQDSVTAASAAVISGLFGARLQSRPIGTGNFTSIDLPLSAEAIRMSLGDVGSNYNGNNFIDMSSTGGVNIGTPSAVTGNTAGVNLNLSTGIGAGTGGLGLINIETQSSSETTVLAMREVGNSNFVGFRAPISIAADVVWTLPDADATIAGQALVSDAAGTLSWATVSSAVLSDADGDTSISVEATPDNDTIRFDVGDNNGNFNSLTSVFTMSPSVTLFNLPNGNFGTNTAGGQFSLQCGNGFGSGTGGPIGLQAGNGGATGNGGSVLIRGGIGDVLGGTVTLRMGTAGNGTAGDLLVLPGEGTTRDSVVRFMSSNNGPIETRYEADNSANPDYVGFIAPTTIATSVIWTLPDADATTAGEVLSSDAAGTLSWVPSTAKSVFGTGAAPILIDDTDIITQPWTADNVIFVAGNGGPVTAGAPQISSGVNVGDELKVVGTNDANNLTLVDGAGLSLSNDAILTGTTVLSLIWDGTVWLEVSRNI